MKLRTDQEAYTILMNNFDMEANDVNNGLMLPISQLKGNFRIIAVDLTCQRVFEADPNAVEQIEIGGTLSANGNLQVPMLSNKRTHMNYLYPEK